MTKPSWPRIRRAFETLDTPEILELVKELYDLNSTNKALLAVRLDSQGSLELLAEPCRKEIEKAFWPARGFPSCKPGNAKKAVAQFVKVAPPLEALEMELYFVESGIRCTRQYGDIDEGFYISLEKMWEIALRRALTLELSEEVEEKLEHIFSSSKDFGWGFSDEMESLWEGFGKAREGQSSSVF